MPALQGPHNAQKDGAAPSRRARERGIANCKDQPEAFAT
jgi:hypothetical protein